STAPKEADVNKFLTQHPQYGDRTQISWDSNLKSACARNTSLIFDPTQVRTGLYRPFTKSSFYFDQHLNQRRYQLPRMFPTPAHDNICIGISAPSLRTPFSVLGFDILPNLGLYMDPVQVFSRFTWEPVAVPEGELDLGALENTTQEPSVYGTPGEVIAGYQRIDNITDEITEIYRAALGSDVSRDDIFHFV